MRQTPFVLTELDASHTEELTDVMLNVARWEEDARVKILHRSGRKAVAMARVADLHSFVKVYLPRPGVHGLKEWLRRSPGVSLWHIGHRVLRAGVPTPKPLLAGEVRRGRLLDLSFFACEALDDAVSIEEAVPMLLDRRKFVVRLADRMARARNRGFVQPDLKASNLFIRGPLDGDYDVVFTDLRRAAIGGPFAGWLGRKTRRYLRYRILDFLGFEEPDIEAFLAVYDEKARAA